MKLTELDILAVDCQTTGATPAQGRMIELGWQRCRAHAPGDAGDDGAVSRLIALPDGDTLPGRIAGLTGISHSMLADAPSLETVWGEFRTASDRVDRLVAHYAQFERRFLGDDGGSEGRGDATPPLLCTHAIAERLYPGLPRRGLRTLAGFFGHPVERPNRAGSHVRATVAIWRRLVAELDERRGITTLDELTAWLDEPPPSSETRTYAIERDRRLELPDRPGVYHLLGADGDVLYVGKATSLRRRVNQYFQTRRGLSERKLELVPQVHDVDVHPTATPLEAALLETDRIKERTPPYNQSLQSEGRRVETVDPDTVAGAIGPPDGGDGLPVSGTASLAALETVVAALEHDETPDAVECRPFDEPPVDALEAALLAFAEKHDLEDAPDPDRIAQLGLELWAAKKAAADEDDEAEETERTLVDDLESVVRRATAKLRLGLWLTRLPGAALAWVPDIWDDEASGWRFLGLDGLEIDAAETVADRATARRRVLDWQCDPAPIDSIDDFDRLRVLTTELRRLTRQQRPVSMRTAGGVVLDARSLKACLELV